MVDLAKGEETDAGQADRNAAEEEDQEAGNWEEDQEAGNQDEEDLEEDADEAEVYMSAAIWPVWSRPRWTESWWIKSRLARLRWTVTRPRWNRFR